jgi:hypothetical protein
MLKNTILLTVWYIQASFLFLSFATFDIIEVKPYEALSGYHWSLAGGTPAFNFTCEYYETTNAERKTFVFSSGQVEWGDSALLVFTVL